MWRTNDILVIDRSSGNVRAAINASGLLTVEESESADVLNGIAYLEESGRGERAFDIYSRLLRERIVFLGEPVTINTLFPITNPAAHAARPE